MMIRGDVILNVNVPDVGFHPAAWRAPDLYPMSFIDPDYYAEVARIAERKSRYRRAREFADGVTAPWRSAQRWSTTAGSSRSTAPLPVPPFLQGRPLRVQAGGAPRG